MSRRKQLSVVYDVANAQKQGVTGVRLALRPVRLCFKRERHLGRADMDAVTSFTHLFIKLIISRCSAVGSAPVSGTGGLEFESPHFDQKRTDSPCGCLFFFCLRVRFDSIRAYARRSPHAPSEDLKACFQGEGREHLRPRRIPPHKTALVVVCSFFFLLKLCSAGFALRNKMDFAYSSRRSTRSLVKWRVRIFSLSTKRPPWFC